MTMPPGLREEFPPVLLSRPPGLQRVRRIPPPPARRRFRVSESPPRTESPSRTLGPVPGPGTRLDAGPREKRPARVPRPGGPGLPVEAERGRRNGDRLVRTSLSESDEWVALRRACGDNPVGARRTGSRGRIGSQGGSESRQPTVRARPAGRAGGVRGGRGGHGPERTRRRSRTATIRRFSRL